MTQNDLIKLHALLSKMQLAISEVSQINPNFEIDHAVSLQQLKEFSNQLTHLEEGLKSAKVISHTFRDAN